MVTRKPTLWFDPVEKSVHRFGGCPYNNATVAVFTFPVNDQGTVAWMEEYTGGVGSQSSVSTFSGFTNPAYALTASTPSAYYSMGGFMTGLTDPALAGLGLASYPLEGLIEYYFSEKQWSNSSSTAFGGKTFGNGAGFAISGQSIYVPIFGRQGILVMIGGDAPTAQQPYTEGDFLVSMDQITVYDIDSQSFYLQTAGGTIPNPRTSFCAVGAGSADNSTWEMYVNLISLNLKLLSDLRRFIYGGSHPGTSTTGYSLDNNATVLGLDKVYILTLPAFQWFEANETSGTTRSYHHCEVIGQRQMLSIGGQAINSNLTVEDPWRNGLGIFDMSELTWGFSYDANAAAYTPPTPISSYYNASNRFPSFSDAALTSIFNNTSTSASASSTSTSNTPSKTPSASTSPTPSPKSSSHTGAIIGGVIGGVLFIALLAGSCYLYWRRHNGQKNSAGYDIYPPKNPEMDISMVPEMDEQRRSLELYSRRHDPQARAELYSRSHDPQARAELVGDDRPRRGE